VNFKRYDSAIINRGFWPQNQIIGEALLQLSEMISDKGMSVVVIAQGDNNSKEMARNLGRGSGTLFQLCKSRSNSSSTLLLRIFDAMIFMIWVSWSLLLTRPKKIYVATDPPILIPFIVFLYSKVFKASYTYHVQDIHPEAAHVAVKINPVLYSLLRIVDSLVLRHSTNIITITKVMKNEIITRSGAKCNIQLISNPTVETNNFNEDKVKGFVFSGNAGRLQKIPLLLESIREYRDRGGTLPFLFIGAGLHSSKIQLLSKEYNDITYQGQVHAKMANELTAKYEWALLPIEDEVTKYAFPSKLSSYVFCGSNILAICSSWTSVAKWVVSHNYGINVSPYIDNIVKAYFKIENGLTVDSGERETDKFSIKNFVESIYAVMFDKPDSAI